MGRSLSNKVFPVPRLIPRPSTPRERLAAGIGRGKFYRGALIIHFARTYFTRAERVKPWTKLYARIPRLVRSLRSRYKNQNFPSFLRFSAGVWGSRQKMERKFWFGSASDSEKSSIYFSTFGCSFSVFAARRGASIRLRFSASNLIVLAPNPPCAPQPPAILKIIKRRDYPLNFRTSDKTF